MPKLSIQAEVLNSLRICNYWFFLGCSIILLKIQDALWDDSLTFLVSSKTLHPCPQQQHIFQSRLAIR